MKRAVALALLLGVLATDGQSGSATLFDRTYICTVPPEYPGGDPAIKVAITPRRTVPSGVWGAGGGVSISRGGYGGTSIFSINTGPVDARRPNGYLLFNPRVCALRKERITLSPRGLPGPPVLFEQYLECRVTRRILFRLRAPIDRVPRFRASRGNRIATVNFTEATYAVAIDRRSATPIPIAFGVIAKTGETRFFSSPRCD